MPFSEAQPGGKSVGVPGNIRMMAEAHERYGKLPWAALFQPAIKLARDGFRVTPRLHNALDSARRPARCARRRGRMFYGADGNPLPVGTIVRNPRFATFLEQLAARGADSFYVGPNAQAIAAAVSGAAAQSGAYDGGRHRIL